ncbi:hypothetical protein [Pontibacter kalidii]|uniref:hypothetical protein n=1 Tax=Pontibacter kalidii TaxID=2592049 RepID=UPI0022504BFB|nr:hypothetical protein [Pontibacter kalidii]
MIAIEKLTDFAQVITKTDEGHQLLICGEVYQAWNYDSYIYDAVSLAKRWYPHQITFERIVHLRHWIRENIQHGHNSPTAMLFSMRSVKYWIDELIEMEYGHDSYWDEQKQLAWDENEKIFSRSNNKPKGCQS